MIREWRYTSLEIFCSDNNVKHFRGKEVLLTCSDELVLIQMHIRVCGDSEDSGQRRDHWAVDWMIVGVDQQNWGTIH